MRFYVQTSLETLLWNKSILNVLCPSERSQDFCTFALFLSIKATGLCQVRWVVLFKILGEGEKKVKNTKYISKNFIIRKLWKRKQ